MCVNDVGIDQTLFFNLLLHLLILNLPCHFLFFHLNLFLLDHSFSCGVAVLLVFVDGNNFVQGFLALHIEISECLCDIADIDE